nr:hypothetical protein 2 [Coxiellaceae bacterium]
MLEQETSLSNTEKLRRAVAAYDLVLVEQLVIEQDIEKTVRDASGTPIIYAAIKKIGKKSGGNAPYTENQRKAYKIARRLITYGFALDEQDALGNTALHQAIRGRHNKLITLLIREGCDVNKKNKRGETPLYFAAETNDIALFTQIVNARNIDPYVVLNDSALPKPEDEETIFNVLKERQTQSGESGQMNKESAEEMERILRERVRLKNLRVQHINNLAMSTQKTASLVPTLQQQNRKVFVSYSWSQAVYSTLPMVDSFCDHLKENGITCYRDKDETTGIATIGAGYLERFMRTAVSDSNVTLAFINEAYLKSRNCLFELSQFWDKSDKNNPKFKDNLQIVIHPELNLYGNATNATRYINYWKERKQGNNTDAKSIDDIEQQRQHIDEADFLKEVADNIAGMINYMATKRVYPSWQELRTSGYHAVFEKAMRLDPPSITQETAGIAHGSINFRESLKMFEGKLEKFHTKDEFQKEKVRIEDSVNKLKSQIELNRQEEARKRQQFETEKEKQIAGINDKIAELEGSLNNSVERSLGSREQISQQITQLKDELERVRASEKADAANQLASETRKMEDKQTEYEKKLQMLDGKIASFNQQQSEVQTRQNSDATALNQLQKDSTDLVTQLKDLQDKINQLETELETLKTEKANTADLPENLTGRLQSTEAQLQDKANLADLPESLGSRLKSTEDQLKAKANSADLPENLGDRLEAAENQITKKADASVVAQGLQRKLSKTDFETQLQTKANATDLPENLTGRLQIAENQLQTKASTADLPENLTDRLQTAETQLADKADKSSLPDNLANRMTELETQTATTSRQVGNISPRSFFIKGSLFSKELSAFELVKRKSAIYKEKYDVSNEEVVNVLDSIVRGRLEEVKAALDESKRKNNGFCALLHVQGDITKADSGESFRQLTPWQFALRESDIGMCKLILDYFSDNHDAAEQMNGLKQDQGLIRTYGSPFYDLGPMIKAYEELKQNWNNWSWQQRNKHWCEVIGRFQKSAPAWYRYDITRLGYNAPWCKKTVCAEPAIRDATAYGVSVENSWAKGYKNQYTLGGKEGKDGYAWVRATTGGCLVQCAVLYVYREEGGIALVVHDAECLSIEQASVIAYRETLEAQFRALSHGGGGIAIQPPA